MKNVGTETLADIAQRGTSQHEELDWWAMPLDTQDLELDRIVIHTDRIAHASRWAGLRGLKVYAEDGDKGAIVPRGLSLGGQDTIVAATTKTIPAERSRRTVDGNTYESPAPFLETYPIGRFVGHVVINNNGISERVEKITEASWSKQVDIGMREAIRSHASDRYIMHAPVLSKLFTSVLAVGAADAALKVPIERLDVRHVLEGAINYTVPGLSVFGDPDKASWLDEAFNMFDVMPSNERTLIMYAAMMTLRKISALAPAVLLKEKFRDLDHSSAVVYGIPLDRVLMARIRSAPKLVSVKK